MGDQDLITCLKQQAIHCTSFFFCLQVPGPLAHHVAHTVLTNIVRTTIAHNCTHVMRGVNESQCSHMFPFETTSYIALYFFLTFFACRTACVRLLQYVRTQFE